MLSYTLVYSFGFPRILLYVDDALVLLLLLILIRTGKRFGIILGPMVIFALLCLSGLIGQISNGINIISYVWGIRNIGKFFVFFLACCLLLSKEDYDRIIVFVKALFFLSFPLCIFERFAVHYPSGVIIGDMIGGFFWNYSGSNLPLNVVLCITLICYSIDYFNGKKNLLSFAFVSGLSLSMAVVAELKVFLVEYLLIVLLAMFSGGFTSKRLTKGIIAAALIAACSTIVVSSFISLNGTYSKYSDIFSFEGLFKYASRETGYNGGGDLNRLNGIITVSKDIFNYDIFKCAFGMGLGSAEYTSFFTTNFYEQYGTLNYQWFQSIWTFIEIGAVGSVLYLILVCYPLFMNVVYKVKERKQLVFILTFTSVLLYLYNISLRSETGGFLIFALLSYPFIDLRNPKKIDQGGVI